MELKSNPKLIIIRGLPGAGKSTLAKKMIAENPDFLHFEADMYFVKDGVYTFVASQISKAHEWCQNSTRTALQHGKSVIVSNTFTTRREAQPYLSMAEKLGISYEIVTLTDNYGSIHNVPQETINKMQARFELLIFDNL